MVCVLVCMPSVLSRFILVVMLFYCGCVPAQAQARSRGSFVMRSGTFPGGPMLFCCKRKTGCRFVSGARRMNCAQLLPCAICAAVPDIFNFLIEKTHSKCDAKCSMSKPTVFFWCVANLRVMRLNRFLLWVSRPGPYPSRGCV